MEPLMLFVLCAVVVTTMVAAATSAVIIIAALSEYKRRDTCALHRSTAAPQGAEKGECS